MLLQGRAALGRASTSGREHHQHRRRSSSPGLPTRM